MKKYIRLFLLIITISIIQALPAKAYWEEVENIPAPYNTNYWLDVFFLPSNPQYGWACGYNGYVIRTTDGGATWRGAQVSPNAYHLESVCFVNQNVGYVSGVPGIFRTNDGGATWTDVTVPDMVGRLWGCYFLTENVGVAVGGGCENGLQSFYRTTNAGQTWTEYQTNVFNSGMTDAILYSENGLGYAVGSGYLYVTNDGGVSWSVFASTELDPANNRWHEEITHEGNSFLIPYSGFICAGGGTSGGMYFSQNNGQSWNRFSTGAPMFGTFLIDDHTGWACGYYGLVYYTENSGATWTKRNCGIDPSRNLDDIWFITPTNGWVVGNGVFHLAADRSALAKDTLHFKSVCYPGSKIDSVTFYNQSFSALSVHANLAGTDRSEFYLDSPESGDIIEIPPCDSITYVIEFGPRSVGTKTAELDIYAGTGETQYTVHLSGYASGSTAATTADTVDFDSVYCNIEKCDTLGWTAKNRDEYIDSIAISDASSSDFFNADLTGNIHLGSNAYKQSYCFIALDTGYYRAKYTAFLSPCNKSKTIMAKAYALSSIINGRSDTISMKCPPSQSGNIQMKLPISNTGNFRLKIDEVQLNNPHFEYAGFVIAKKNGNAELPVIIEPGKNDTLVLNVYLPDNIVNDSCQVLLINNDSTKIRGNKNPFALSAVVLGSYALIKTSRTNYPDSVVCVGMTYSVDFDLINPTGNAGSFSVQSKTHNCTISLNPPFESPLKMNAGVKKHYTISVYPSEAGKFDVKIYFNDPACSTVSDSLVLSGIAIDVKIKTSVKMLQLKLQTGEPDSLEFDIAIQTSTPISLDSAWLKHPIPGLVFDYSPKNFTATGDTTIHMKVYFTASTDTSYVDSLMLMFSGLCNHEIALPVNISSVAAKLKTTEPYLNFADIDCSADTLLLPVHILNYGLAADSLTKMEIVPPDAGFFIAETPLLPLMINENQTVPVKIGFMPKDTGTASAELRIYSIKMNGNYLAVPLSAYFAVTNLQLQSETSRNFGYIEKCDKIIYDTVKIENKGNLSADVKAEFSAGNNGFSLIDKQKNISQFSDGEFVFALNPAEIKDGSIRDALILSDETCGRKITVPLEYFGVNKSIELSKTNVDFGEIWPGNSYFDTVNITNKSNVEIIISKVNFNTSQEYGKYITYSGIKEGDALQINETRPVVFSFISENKSIDEAGGASADFSISYESSCDNLAKIGISGSIPEEKYSVNIKTERYLKRPNEEFSINIINVNPPIHQAEVDSIKFRVNYEPRLAHCEYAVYGDSTIEIAKDAAGFSFNLRGSEAEKFLNTATDTVRVHSIAMLSLPDSCALDITGTEIFSTKRIMPSYENGLLRIYGYCTGTAPYYDFEKFNVSASISSNKSGEIELTVKSDISAEMTAEIFDMTGAKISEETFNVAGNSVRELASGRKLSSGAYFVRIKLYGNTILEKTIVSEK